MAIPMVMMAAKAGGLARTAQPVLAEWNKLDPAAKAQVQGQASSVMTDLDRVRRALGARLFARDEGELSGEDARALALNPTPEFLMAKELVQILLDLGELDEASLRQSVGAADEADAVFRVALNIAEEDGYVATNAPGVWRITNFADRVLDG